MELFVPLSIVLTLIGAIAVAVVWIGGAFFDETGKAPTMIALPGTVSTIAGIILASNIWIIIGAVIVLLFNCLFLMIAIANIVSSKHRSEANKSRSY